MEKNTPDYKEAIKDLIYLSKRYSPAHLVWRFDPICITDKLNFNDYEDMFKRCLERLSGHVQMCYISFANPYHKMLRNIERYTNHSYLSASEDKKRDFAANLANIARESNINIFSCCNDYLLSDKVFKGSCIDGHYLTKLFNFNVNINKAPSRKECACTKSIDIGAYNTCPHECMYCYANTDKNMAIRIYKQQQPEWNALGTNVIGEDAESAKEEFYEKQPDTIQRTLF